MIDRIKYPFEGTPDTLKKVMEFDIGTLYRLAFGYVGLPLWVPPETPDVFEKERDFKLQKIPHQDPYTQEGIPYYEAPGGHLVFLPLYYWTFDEQGRKSNRQLFPLCTVSAAVSKLIVKTPLVGKNGSVKELIRSEDATFNVRGLCIGYDGTYPETAVSLIIALSQSNQSIEIAHPVVSKFSQGAMRVVIESMNFPENKGIQNVVPFEMTFVSDNILELTIED